MEWDGMGADSRSTGNGKWLGLLEVLQKILPVSNSHSCMASYLPNLEMITIAFSPTSKTRLRIQAYGLDLKAVMADSSWHWCNMLSSKFLVLIPKDASSIFHSASGGSKCLY